MADVILLINLCMCLFIFWACVCRLKMTSDRILWRVRNRYTIIGTGALFGGFGHWIFDFYGGGYLGQCIFVGSIVVGFWLDKVDWDRGPPDSATKPGELHEDKRER